MSIVFKINGKQHEVDGAFTPDYTLNEYIRTVADLRGSKAMCHEGGCGVCVVSVKTVSASGDVRIFAVNSCLVSVLSCHGWEVTTIEGIGNRTDGYHEIQTRLAKFNGTQCGFCSPGWVMSMYSVYESKNKSMTLEEIENSFASNLCRCTGYRSIADAFKSFAKDADKTLLHKVTDIEDLSHLKPCGVKCKQECKHRKGKSYCTSEGEEDWCIVEKSNPKRIVLNIINSTSHKWYKAFTLKDVFEAIGNDSDYKLIAGNTGQGVYHVTQYPKKIVDIFNVAELKGYKIDVNLEIGAGMSMAEMMDLFKFLSKHREEFTYLKELNDHLDLVAHIPVKNIGTIGGNLFLKHENNIFPSDLFVLFETIGAMITIGENSGKRIIISLVEFLTYNMDKKIIINVMLPPLGKHCKVKTYKIMPRAQNAQAIVNCGFMFEFKKNSTIIERVSLVYGNISPTFIHAKETENILHKKDPFSNVSLSQALKSLSEDIKPIEIPGEPSANYRKMLALSLFYKAILYLCPESKLNKRFRSGGDVIKRGVSHGSQTYDTDTSLWPLNQPIPKLEALTQCSGEAIFANDIPTQTDEVFGAFITADVPAGSVIDNFDASEALKLPDIYAFYSYKDIPGANNFTTDAETEEILCSGKVKFFGQPAGIIVGKREKLAHRAAKLVKIMYKSINKNKPLLTSYDVMKSNEKEERIKVTKVIHPTEKGKEVYSVLNGEVRFDTQYHFFMETQTCITKPVEDGIEVYSSTQWLDVITIAVARCIKIPESRVNVIVRRLGGGYGGKITRSTQIACAAALVTHLLGKTCRFVLPLQTNMKIGGKRLPTYCKFEVGVNKEGEIQYLINKFYQEGGCSFNDNINIFTLTHISNCYDPKRWYIEANHVVTDTPSNTWCRAPASTEAVAMTEYIMERIAYNLRKDPIKVRLTNMIKINNPIPNLIHQLLNDSKYCERSNEVKLFNENNRWRKRAIKIIPLTYDLFHMAPYNAIVSVQHGDGSVMITHGGVEMGQGINTKVAQVCAYVLGIPLEKVSVKPSSNLTSPNAVSTGASTASDCVAYATAQACKIILERLEPIKEKSQSKVWEDLVEEAFSTGIDLQASYMHSGNDNLKPYKVYAVVGVEVEVDILTGNHEVRRVDLLEDTGRSLSPEIDVGQIEGAFIMGLGYWTSEKIVYDPYSGEILTDRTWTYKPPGMKDIPADFRVYFVRNSWNKYGVLHSKATGEPSFCLAVAVTHALRETIRASRIEAGYEDQWIDIGHPCTTENIFMAAGHKIEHFKLQ